MCMYTRAYTTQICIISNVLGGQGAIEKTMWHAGIYICVNIYIHTHTYICMYAHIRAHTYVTHRIGNIWAGHGGKERWVWCACKCIFMYISIKYTCMDIYVYICMKYVNI